MVKDRDKGLLNTFREFCTEPHQAVGYNGQPVTAHKVVGECSSTTEVVPRYFAPSSAHVAEDGFCFFVKKEKQHDNY